MKNPVFFVFFLFLILSGCSEDDNKFASEGLITGIDTRECLCCGGYYIEIKDSTYRFYDLPPERNFNLDNPEFPIAVKLDWKASDERCLGDEIDVLRIILK